MRRIRTFGTTLAVLACWSLVVPQLTFAAKTTAPTAKHLPPSTPKDITLLADGSLKGQVVDAQGIAQATTKVAIVKDSQLVTIVTTDANGEFRAENLSGGVYQIGTDKSSGVYRLWTSRTAPPAAQNAALVVSDASVARGQFGGPLLGFLANPWVLAAIVAAAIAIPLALDDDDAS